MRLGQHPRALQKVSLALERELTVCKPPCYPKVAAPDLVDLLLDLEEVVQQALLASGGVSAQAHAACPPALTYDLWFVVHKEMRLYKMKLTGLAVRPHTGADLGNADEGRPGGQGFKLPLGGNKVPMQIQVRVFVRVGQNINGARSESRAKAVDCQRRPIGESGSSVVPTPVEALVPIKHNVDLHTLFRRGFRRDLGRKPRCAEGSTLRRCGTFALTFCPLVKRVASPVLRVHPEENGS